MAAHVNETLDTLECDDVGFRGWFGYAAPFRCLTFGAEGVAPGCARCGLGCGRRCSIGVTCRNVPVRDRQSDGRGELNERVFKRRLVAKICSFSADRGF